MMDELREDEQVNAESWMEHLQRILPKTQA